MIMEDLRCLWLEKQNEWFSLVWLEEDEEECKEKLVFKGRRKKSRIYSGWVLKHLHPL